MLFKISMLNNHISLENIRGICRQKLFPKYLFFLQKAHNPSLLIKYDYNDAKVHKQNSTLTFRKLVLMLSS